MVNKSSNLHIFPCSNRKVNQGDNYVTQKNLTNIIKHLPASGNYVVSTTADADPFCFFIKGYYVEITGGLRAFAGIESGDIYASVNISDGYLSGSDSSDDLTTSTQDFIKFNNESGDLLLVDEVDENDYVPTLPISGNGSLSLQNKSIDSSAKIELKKSGTDKRPEVLVRSGAGDSDKPGLTYIAAYNADNTAKSQLTLSGSGNGEIILYTNNSNGVINIGTDSIKPTVNINSTRTNISSASTIQLDTNDSTGIINIGTSIIKPTVNINSTKTNISGNTTVNGNLSVSGTNILKTNYLSANTGTSIQLNNDITKASNSNITINATTINATNGYLKTLSPVGQVTGSSIGTSTNHYQQGFINELTFKKKDATVAKLSTVIDDIETRLSTLGFKTASITMANPNNSGSLKKLGNFVIGEITLTRFHSDTLGTIPDDFRPYANTTMNVPINQQGHDFAIMITMTFSADGNITFSESPGDTLTLKQTKLLFGWDTTDGNYQTSTTSEASAGGGSTDSGGDYTHMTPETK